MPLDNYESQISQLQEHLYLSIAMPLKRFQKSSTIKQHLEYCELERNKMYERDLQTNPPPAKHVHTVASPSRQSQSNEQNSEEQARSSSPTDHLKDLNVRIFDKQTPYPLAEAQGISEQKRQYTTEPVAKQVPRASAENLR